jgi:hypothetical protein
MGDQYYFNPSRCPQISRGLILFHYPILLLRLAISIHIRTFPDQLDPLARTGHRSATACQTALYLILHLDQTIIPLPTLYLTSLILIYHLTLRGYLVSQIVVDQ